MSYKKIAFYIVVFIISATVIGCTKTITETRVEYVRPEIPEAVISPCDPMPSNTSISTNGDLLMAYISLQSSYVVCSSKITSITNILQSYDSIYANKELMNEK